MIIEKNILKYFKSITVIFKHFYISITKLTQSITYLHTFTRNSQEKKREEKKRLKILETENNMWLAHRNNI